MSLSKRRLFTLALMSSAFTAYACADTVYMGQVTETADAAPPMTFTPPPPEDGGDAALPDFPTPDALLCIGTECPFPYATCSNEPAFKCGTNLMNDPGNCGACGVSCGGFDPINMSASCVQGTCEFQCLIKEQADRVRVFKNCNGVLDDGCEVDVNDDAENCGVCGNKCKAGERCIKGKCGCSGGRVDCSGKCVDTRFDNFNCGTCGTVCNSRPPGACSPMPPNTQYGCGNSECGALKCKAGFGDCNNDTQDGCSSDGCEVNLKTDPNHCGRCGNKCGPDQECRDENGNGPQCLDKCDTLGLTQCRNGCKDLLSDPLNCGACGTSCGNPRANQAASQCRKGVCEIDCLPGFADCNGDPNDGCEVDLRVHPANCGACGNKCDFAAGQPCIDGKCLMVECDAGPVEAK